MDYPEAMMKAITATLNAYEELIENPQRNYRKWEEYGHLTLCRLCRVYGPKGEVVYCRGCILGRMGTGPFGENCPCATEPCADLGEVTDRICSVGFMTKSEKEEFFDDLKNAAIKRFDEIVKHLDSIGYEYK